MEEVHARKRRFSFPTFNYSGLFTGFSQSTRLKNEILQLEKERQEIANKRLYILQEMKLLENQEQELLQTLVTKKNNLRNSVP